METSFTYVDGFEYPAYKIKRYISNLELFTLLLTDGRIVHHIAPDETLFKNWLISNNIPDVREQEYINAGIGIMS